MMRSRGIFQDILLAAFTAMLLAAAPASQPVLDQTLAGGQYHLASPPSSEWSAVKSDPNAEVILFENTSHDGAIQLEMLPKDARVDPDIAGNMAVTIMKELARQRAANHMVVVLAPKLEHDHRYAILIHEKYKVGDKTCDERYAYKSIGPRVFLLSVYSLSDDANTVAVVHKAGEAALDSVKFDRRAFRKSK